MKNALNTLSRAFFKPGDLYDLAIVRIVLAGAFLVRLSPGLSEGLRLANEGSAAAFVPLPTMKVLLLPLGEWGARPDPMLIHAIWFLSIVAACLVLIGLWTKPAAFTLAGAYSLLIAHQYSFGEFHHPEGPYAIALWILAFSYSGNVLSLDRIRFRTRMATEVGVFRPSGADRMSPEATWPLKGMQWVLALCYFSAGLFKSWAGGLTWLNGHTLAYYLIQDGVRSEQPLSLALAGIHPLMVALSGFTLFVELTFPLAVLIPVTALFYVVAGFGLHQGIAVLMDARFPHWVVLYVAFLPSLRQGWRRLRGGASHPQRSPRIVVYDGRCRLCLRTMAVLDELDMTRALRFVNGREGTASLPEPLRSADVLHAMHVLEEDGTVRRGFHAFRSVARGLPLLWPLVPLMSLPGANSLGPRIYAVISRKRQLCASGSCLVDGALSTDAPTRTTPA